MPKIYKYCNMTLKKYFEGRRIDLNSIEVGDRDKNSAPKNDN